MIKDLLEGFFPEGIEDIAFYSKLRDEKYKSKGDKKIIKIGKLLKDMSDPLLKKQRNLGRRQGDKKKLNKILGAMKTEEQVRHFIDERKKKKKENKQKVKKAKEIGQPIFIDLVFEDKMNGKQNKSLAKQIQLIYQSIRHMKQTPSIHLCSFKGGIIPQLQKMGYKYWNMNAHEQNIVEVAQKMGKKLVYLSPDAHLPLQSVQQDTAYIIGGLIDRTIIKYASLYRASELNIEARHLPIKYLIANRSCLNLDHVVMILCKFKETKDWKVSFEYCAPQRLKRDYIDGKKQNNEENKSHSNDNSEEQCTQKKQIVKKQQENVQKQQELKQSPS